MAKIKREQFDTLDEQVKVINDLDSRITSLEKRTEVLEEQSLKKSQEKPVKKKEVKKSLASF